MVMNRNTWKHSAGMKIKLNVHVLKFGRHGISF